MSTTPKSTETKDEVFVGKQIVNYDQCYAAELLALPTGTRRFNLRCVKKYQNEEMKEKNCSPLVEYGGYPDVTINREDLEEYLKDETILADAIYAFTVEQSGAEWDHNYGECGVDYMYDCEHVDEHLQAIWEHTLSNDLPVGSFYSTCLWVTDKSEEPEEISPVPVPVPDTTIQLDIRTISDLAQEALYIQDACNLSGVVLAWSRSIRRLRHVGVFTSTDELNQHPINVLFASKVEHVTKNYGLLTLNEAYDKCKELAKQAS